ncbi:MAG: thiopurine S-methyltransferase [Roseovarius sp.]|nr:thiopurine S-methyltransferase [Roseovarius sp.]
MEADFWHTRWENMQIGFHEGAVNRMLSAHIGALGLDPGARIFLPLCGKTRDIAWLLAQGYRVAGAELSDIAVGQLFEELGVTPDITEHGPLRAYAAPGVTIFAGDIFALTPDLLGPVDAVYDRAALVALPAEMRARYTAHMRVLTGTAPQLLVTFEYDPAIMAGPPFSVTAAEVRTHYAPHYRITQLADLVVPGGLKGVCPARELALHLAPR